MPRSDNESRATRISLRRFVASVSLLGLLGCGGGEAAKEDEAPSGPIQPELASRGEELFTAKGCVACHTIGKGRLVGPDLKGLPQRREYSWYVAMVTNPDSMLRNDPIAKQLLAEYYTPMTNQNVTAQDARAIYEYLRDKSELEDDEGEEAEET